MNFEDCRIGMEVVPSIENALYSKDGTACHKKFDTLYISRLNYIDRTITLKEARTDFQMKDVYPMYVNKSLYQTIHFYHLNMNVKLILRCIKRETRFPLIIMELNWQR